MTDFCSLHNHTTYSIMHSLIKPSEFFKRVKELGQSSVGVTDLGTLAGAWNCLKYSKEAGVKLIIGEDFYFLDDVSDVENSSRLRQIVLLAKNSTGYRNLLKLSKAGYDNSIVMFKRVIPRIDWKLLETYKDGLICTTACGGGILGQLINTRKLEEAKRQAKRLKDIFGGSLAIEIQPHSMRRIANLYKDYEDQKFTNYQLIKIADELDIKIIVATGSNYLYKEDFEAQDVMLAIGSGQPVFSGNRPKYTNDFYVKSRDEIKEYLIANLGAFKHRADEFCDNSLIFAAMCEDPEWIDPKFSNPSGKELPQFPVKDQLDYDTFKIWLDSQSDVIRAKDEDESYLRYWCYREFDKRLNYVPDNDKLEYYKRLDEEFDVIEYHGFSSYMLIVADYIEFCAKQNIYVGSGRGSVGGSLIAYLIGIHQADPIKYGLIFARFHNKEKTSFPDIDTDFESAGKELVQEYLRKKYGEDRVAHVSNINTMTPKIYAKGIARALQYGGTAKAAVAIGNLLADSVPKEVETVEAALDGEAPLFATFAADEKYKHLKLYAKHLSGKATAWSTHAGGIVIGNRSLVDIVPLRKDKEGSVAIEYDKNAIEANGLVKMDILGVSTLDVVKNTYRLIAEVGKIPPNLPLNYDDNDPKTYELIGRGDTFCVFQLGTSAGTIDLCRKIQPKSIEDLAVINTLARPAARDIRKPFIEAKESGNEVELLHPTLKRAFASTFGFPIYEECLMYLGQDVAGWDLHQADRLRKLTKDKGKNPEKVAKWRLEFIDGAQKDRGLHCEMATKIWDEIVSKFGGYAFNKSHSVFYSFLGYETAYLKAHFPLEFLTANLQEKVKTKAVGSEEKILKIKNEIRRCQVKIIPPDINKSETTYKIINHNTLMTGLDSLKHMGKKAIPEILAKRPFSSFEDFLSRVDGKMVTAPAIQALAAVGCLDQFGMTRKEMFLYASDYKKKLQVWLKKKNRKDGDIFNYPWPGEKDDWSIASKYALERYYIGEGLSGNKIQAYPGFFNSSAPKFADYIKIFPDPGTPDEHHAIPAFQAEVMGFFEFKVKKQDSKSFGKPMAKIMLEDPFGTAMMMTVFPKQWADFKERVKVLTGGKAADLVPGVAIYARGSLNWYEGDISIIFEDLLKCAPPPPLPTDLEKRKVSMRVSRSRKKTEEIDKEEVLDEIEDEVIEDGLEDLDDDINECDEDDRSNAFN